MPFLEYAKRDTILHKAHPITKIVLLLTFLVIASLYWDWKYLLPFLLATIILYIVAKVPRSWLKYNFAILLLSTPTTGWLAIFQTNPAMYKVYPHDFVNQSFFSYNLPIFGTVGLTYGSLLWLAGFVMKWTITLLAFSIFIYTTSPVEITHTIAQVERLVPLGYVVSVAMKFVPALQRIMSEIISIQSLRGWRSPGRNVFKYPKMLRPITQPFLSRVFLQVEEITMAAQMRGFGSGKVTLYRASKLTLAEIIVVIFSITLLILAIAGLLLYNIGLI
jgi:energy-coupling factor transporter transmembrane protein EcfT